MTPPLPWGLLEYNISLKLHHILSHYQREPDQHTNTLNARHSCIYIILITIQKQGDGTPPHGTQPKLSPALSNPATKAGSRHNWCDWKGSPTDHSAGTEIPSSDMCRASLPALCGTAGPISARPRFLRGGMRMFGKPRWLAKHFGMLWG